MAMIKCPECKKKISDTCDVCIHCGYKIKRADHDSEYEMSYSTMPDEKPIRKLLKPLGIIFGILLAAAAIALVIFIIATYKNRGALTNEIMATAAMLAFTLGVAIAVLCKKLL